MPNARAARGLYDLPDRVALAAGGGSGLGRAMAWSLACHGADLGLVDRDAASAAASAAQIAQGSGRRSASMRAEVSDEAEGRKAMPTLRHPDASAQRANSLAR